MIEKSHQLVDYFTHLDGFYIVDRQAGKTYENMGATIIDGILQSGVKYSTVVAPRVNEYLSLYDNVKTTSDFSTLISNEPIEQVIRWKPGVKPERIKKLTGFFLSKNIETEADLFNWFNNPSNDSVFLNQDGVGCKTLGYFKILSGHVDTSAIDRHLYEFLDRAGISYSGYDGAVEIIKNSAELINVEVSILDHSIWKYMSERA